MHLQVCFIVNKAGWAAVWMRRPPWTKRARHGHLADVRLNSDDVPTAARCCAAIILSEIFVCHITLYERWAVSGHPQLHRFHDSMGAINPNQYPIDSVIGN